VADETAIMTCGCCWNGIPVLHRRGSPRPGASA